MCQGIEEPDSLRKETVALSFVLTRMVWDFLLDGRTVCGRVGWDILWCCWPCTHSHKSAEFLKVVDLKVESDWITLLVSSNAPIAVLAAMLKTVKGVIGCKIHFTSCLNINVLCCTLSHHPIMIKIHPVFFFLNPYFKTPFSNQAVLRFLRPLPW